jgi:hypothetical protein
MSLKAFNNRLLVRVIYGRKTILGAIILTPFVEWTYILHLHKSVWSKHNSFLSVGFAISKINRNTYLQFYRVSDGT